MKQLTVKYRPNADEDLLQLAAYTLERSQDLATARAYINRLYEKCERIGNAPLGGVARGDLGAGIRMTVFERRIVVFYRVENDTVWISNILSGRRDYEAVFDCTPASVDDP